MNCIVLTVIIIFIVIFLFKLFTLRRSEYFLSDEAIQNVASLYNKDELTIGKINIINDATAGKFIDKSMGKPVKEYVDDQDNSIKVNLDKKVKYVGDINFQNENWGPDGQAYGGGVFDKYISPALKNYCRNLSVGSTGITWHSNTNVPFGHLLYKSSDNLCIDFPMRINPIMI